MTQDLRASFTADELAELSANAITLSDASTSDAVRLAESWAQHVSKLDADRALRYDDRTVWTEHDLAASMFMRDFVETASAALRPELRAKLAEFVHAADERFRSFTVDDSGRTMAHVAGVSLAGRGWWWFRVPRDGPIATDLAGY